MPPSTKLSILPYSGFPIGVLRPRGTWMASLGSWMEVSVTLSNRVRQYSFPHGPLNWGNTEP